MKHLLLIFSVLSILSCKNAKEETTTPSEDLELKELFKIMQGSYSSEKQSLQDSTYYNISLHMYPIWEKKGNYLYVEQALFSRQNAPYRQRIYEVSRLNDSIFSSAVYEIENDSLWIGKWKTPEAFDSIPNSAVKLKAGCEVLLKRVAVNYFSGSTNENSCPSSLRGATFATSKVEIFQNKIESWDQGFDKDGNQVWGAEKGGYVFDKLE